jgi:DeoR family fructose operon transcriptional repressor
MLQLERMEKIKGYILQHEYADIKKLAEMLDVSTATIRRALKRLETEKIVDLTRGGAALVRKGNLYEYPYKVKLQMYSEEKRRIAQKALEYIEPNESVFMDSSSTVYAMTDGLSRVRDITIATNDILIAQNLTNAEGLPVTVVGGTLRKHYYTLTGYIAEMVMKDMCFDHAFMGIDSLSLRGGLMITNSEEVQIKRKVISSSNQVLVLCDHSKFEQESFLNVCGFGDVDLIITGRELDEKIYKRYLDEGIHLILA